MNGTRAVTIEFDPDGTSWAEVGPYRPARALLISAGVPKPPLWLPLRAVFSISYARGLDIVALAERLNYEVTVIRREVVKELTEAGLSTRAIAPVVGVSQQQVQRDRSQVTPNVSPDQTSTSSTSTPEDVLF